jgi:hypothetical protein
MVKSVPRNIQFLRSQVKIKHGGTAAVLFRIRFDVNKKQIKHWR